MAAELELVSTKRLEGRLVAAVSRKPVPNRLSDTSKSQVANSWQNCALLHVHTTCTMYKFCLLFINPPPQKKCALLGIFVKVTNNEAVQIHPTVIHFDGYKVGETHKQTLVRKLNTLSI